jgi:hypothetical protein
MAWLMGSQGTAHEVVERRWLGLISNSLGVRFDVGSIPFQFHCNFTSVSSSCNPFGDASASHHYYHIDFT